MAEWRWHFFLSLFPNLDFCSCFFWGDREQGLDKRHKNGHLVLMLVVSLSYSVTKRDTHSTQGTQVGGRLKHMNPTKLLG